MRFFFFTFLLDLSFLTGMREREVKGGSKLAKITAKYSFLSYFLATSSLEGGAQWEMGATCVWIVLLMLVLANAELTHYVNGIILSLLFDFWIIVHIFPTVYVLMN